MSVPFASITVTFSLYDVSFNVLIMRLILFSSLHAMPCRPTNAVVTSAVRFSII